MNKIILIFSVSILLVSFTNYSFAQTDDRLAVLETNLGTITIEFFSDDAPKHVENFIGLAESGFYDGVLFHRIIPGFMIQGGDPNTIDGDPSTWGTGGPSTSVDAEFNTIKHNRGIVSMARSADPNSGGSQFFIVHADSNFLDEQYTVFGRIVTDESFETLDKIAAVQTKPNDQPVNSEEVRISKISIVNRSEVSNLLNLGDPERTETPITPSTGNQRYEIDEYGITFTAPEGWLLQTPEKTISNSPDVVAVGPKIGSINPVISLTVEETHQRTMDDLIFNKTETIKQVVEAGNLNIISQEKISINENQAYVINAIGTFFSNDESFDVKFREIMIFDTDKVYTFAYSNGVNEFDSQLPRFEETIDSFEILSQDKGEEGGGCLIATATYGSELAPQVQQLRELRDNKLLQTESGTLFINSFNEFYYSFSPYIADYERENPIFKDVVKITLTPLITTLSVLNHVNMDSEESVLGYGISLILLNVGMYFVAPAIIIVGIKKQLA